MNFAEQLALTAEAVMKERAKVVAGNLSGKLIEAADKGLFKLELLLKNDTAEDKAKNEIAISREFTELLEGELDGVRVCGEVREERNFFGQTYPKYYWVLEWD